VLPSQPDDVALVRAFRAGDRRAFDALVRRHQAPVRALARRFCRDADEADDLAQRAFIRALEHVDELRGAFRPWLLRIVVNLARNHVRDTAKFVPADDAPEPSAEAGQEAGIDAVRRAERLRSAIRTLPPRQREVVLLRVDGQLSFGEIGNALGITENNAKVNYHHGVRRLQQTLGRES